MSPLSGLGSHDLPGSGGTREVERPPAILTPGAAAYLRRPLRRAGTCRARGGAADDDVALVERDALRCEAVKGTRERPLIDGGPHGAGGRHVEAAVGRFVAPERRSN